MESRKPRIFGIGEIVLDIVMRDGKPLAAVPGGSTFNAMVSLGRTLKDYEIYMISQIGDDKVADIVRNFMAGNNVRSEYLRFVQSRQSTISLALLDERNDAKYEFFRDNGMPEFKAGNISFRKGDIVIFGSFFAVSAETRCETQRLLRSAREAGAVIYYDVNFRKSHMLQRSEVLSAIEENCSLSSVVRASSEDIFNIYDTSDPDAVYGSHLSRLCPLFICTRGAESTHMFMDEKQKYDFSPEKIETVSTIGAGDSFNAGFVYGMIKYGLSAEKVPQLLSIASGFSKNVCQSLYNYVDIDFHPDR